MQPPQLLSPPEVSELLGVSIKTLAHWRTTRTGPLFIRVGVHVRYRPADINEWISLRVEEGRQWQAS